MFSINVVTKRPSAKAKAERVLMLSNSWSPVKRTTICVVTVVTELSGFAVRFAATPAAIKTIIVSPIALEIANKNPPTIPGSAAGKTTSKPFQTLLIPLQ